MPDSHIPTSVVLFKLGEKSCACGIDLIYEVTKAQDIYPVPNRHPLVEGIINLRGMIIPVIKLASLLHQYDTNTTDESKNKLILVALVSTFYIGLLVDQVIRIDRITSLNPDESSLDPDKKNAPSEDEQDNSYPDESDLNWLPHRFMKATVLLESGIKCPLIDSHNISQALWAYVPDQERGH